MITVAASIKALNPGKASGQDALKLSGDLTSDTQANNYRSEMQGLIFGGILVMTVVLMDSSGQIKDYINGTLVMDDGFAIRTFFHAFGLLIAAVLMLIGGLTSAQLKPLAENPKKAALLLQAAQEYEVVADYVRRVRHRSLREVDLVCAHQLWMDAERKGRNRTSSATLRELDQI